MFPQATAWAPAALRIDSSIPTVVVLPLVPVTTSQDGGGPRTRPPRQASSTPPITSTPASAAATSSGDVGRQPGLVTTRTTSDGGSVRPGPSSAPSPSSSARRSALPSVTVTRAPSSVSTGTIDLPVTPAPATRT